MYFYALRQIQLNSANEQFYRRKKAQSIIKINREKITSTETIISKKTELKLK